MEEAEEVEEEEGGLVGWGFIRNARNLLLDTKLDRKTGQKDVAGRGGRSGCRRTRRRRKRKRSGCKKGTQSTSKRRTSLIAHSGHSSVRNTQKRRRRRQGKGRRKRLIRNKRGGRIQRSRK